MRRMTIAAALSLLASDAMAISRYDPTEMACASLQAIILTEGAVILRYASSSVLGLPVYDRFVRSRDFCSSGEVIRSAGVPTADSKYCPVKKCVESDIFVDN
jgi:hypothetical protein